MRVLQHLADAGFNVKERSLKHMKLWPDEEQDHFGEKWCWETFLKKLHYFLDQETAGFALAWLQGGSHFIIHHSKEVDLAKQLGLQGCSLCEALQTLGFEFQEESDWEYTIYHHLCFTLGKPETIEEILQVADKELFISADQTVSIMPSIAYSSELKPLEVRLSLPDSHSQPWEVTIAPSALSHATFDTTDELMIDESTAVTNYTGEHSWGSILGITGEGSDPDINSPLWWSQRSDFSSICSDDLSGMDTLSQISSFFY
ncbi:hypothetical protein P3T76_001349 [Phytophthora citrophthora]|uniref:Uncharacterized protein n=1 Tax=Phytophthora citrophthora TaxID=4793 RepID=A0AAD9GYB0_9STRA|nr:hypothetical protein P3T76_001349 [Phytophthora citrophthora]